MDKKKLRKILLDRRNSIDSNLRKEFDSKIFEKVKPILNKYDNIASYYSFNQEVDTLNINKWILANNKNLYLPKVVDGDIKFCKVNSLNDVSLGTFNVCEPISNEFVDSNIIQCMLVPLLGFNDENYRIGYGKGYYDRALKYFKGKSIGIAYDIQYCKNLIVDDYDEKLDMIVKN